LANKQKLLYEAQLYLNWRSTGHWPLSIYEMDVETVHCLFAIQNELG